MTRWIASNEGDIYRYRANAAVVSLPHPAHTVVGPAPCRGCRRLVFYAYGQTRTGWNQVRGKLRWRDATGSIHQCP